MPRLKILCCLPLLDLSFFYFLLLFLSFPSRSLSHGCLCSYCWTRRLARTEVSDVYYKEFHFSVGLETTAHECERERKERKRERETWGSTAPDTGCSRPLCQWGWMRGWQLQQDPHKIWYSFHKKRCICMVLSRLAQVKEMLHLKILIHHLLIWCHSKITCLTLLGLGITCYLTTHDTNLTILCIGYRKASDDHISMFFCLFFPRSSWEMFVLLYSIMTIVILGELYL